MRNGEAWASCFRGCRDVYQGSQEESMASHRKMLIEMIDCRRFIGGDSVSYPQCSGQLRGGSLILHGLYSVPKLLGISATRKQISV